MLARIKIRHIRLKHDSRLKLAKPTTLAGLDLFEQGDPGYFVKKEPSPFKDMKGFFLRVCPKFLTSTAMANWICFWQIKRV
jgi:hypothetical protein